MDGSSLEGQRRFAQCFRYRRVRVHRACDAFHVGAAPSDLYRLITG